MKKPETTTKKTVLCRIRACCIVGYCSKAKRKQIGMCNIAQSGSTEYLGLDDPYKKCEEMLLQLAIRTIPQG